MSFLGLSTELIQSIASFLPQVDLLNISFTCKRLHDATEPELLRVYLCPRGGNPIAKFVKRLLEDPNRMRHVQIVHLKDWITLSRLSPKEVRDRYEEGYDELVSQPDESDYRLFTEAAKANGVIDTILPYETESSLLARLENERFGEQWRPWTDNIPWQETVFDDQLEYDDIPCYSIFCQQLRAGIDEPLIQILLAMLPNLRELYLHDIPHDEYALPWLHPRHESPLRKLVAQGVGRDHEWPISFVQHGISGQLESLELYAATSWGNDPRTRTYVRRPLHLPPGRLNIGRIDLEACLLTYWDMETLLDTCSGLKSFRFSLGEVKDGADNFTSTELVTLLSKHKSSLEELHIDLSHHWPRGWDLNPIASLDDFTSLRTISMNPRDLDWMAEDLSWFARDGLPKHKRLHNRLPKSLEHLTFFELKKYYSDDLNYRTRQHPQSHLDMKQLQALLSRDHGSLPNLASVTLIVPEEEPYLPLHNHTDPI
ncbi:hypothetical protein BDV96DRAFT_112721 [Lophiotrema nucula]|uniref:F-box domain-containing protein n=1 Tax=Lophiotrema nucula TaxID=690887 RepID=A0A6A5Z4A4_9PLEO|nr:hypothetical protein BDV96DRAFT_112721 [Lophiotrema nucula]